MPRALSDPSVLNDATLKVNTLTCITQGDPMDNAIMEEALKENAFTETALRKNDLSKGDLNEGILRQNDLDERTL